MCGMFSQARPPIVSRERSSVTSAYDRPDRSTTARASASSSGAYAQPNRFTPRRSPSARSSAWPSASAQSSAVWWSSTWRSPSHASVTSNRAWRLSASSKWSRKPRPVFTSALPVPSRVSVTVIDVSRVARLRLRCVWSWCQSLGIERSLEGRTQPLEVGRITGQGDAQRGVEAGAGREVAYQHAAGGESRADRSGARSAFDEHKVRLRGPGQEPGGGKSRGEQAALLAHSRDVCAERLDAALELGERQRN